MLYADQIVPGLLFFFDEQGDAYPEDRFEETAPWMVIAREARGVKRLQRPFNSVWFYLLLGPGPTLRWHEGNLGEIRVVGGG
jgi:hypothetical protein